MNQSLLQPEILEPSTQNARWMVLIYNNPYNTMDEVIEILMRATGCDMDEAYIEMWEAHTFGKASVHFAAKVDCEEAATVIRTVGVKAEVVPEWTD